VWDHWSELHGAEASAGGNPMVSSQYGAVLSPSTIPGSSVVPFKFNTNRRHAIPRQRRRVMNWSEYDAALRQLGGLTVWFSEAAIAGWKAKGRNTPGGQPHYSALAILTALSLWAVFGLALRQTERLIGSVIGRHAPDRGQHESEVSWPRRMAGREVRHPDPPLLAEAAHRQGCRQSSHGRRRTDDKAIVVSPGCAGTTG
jgi:hypothetical protein